MNGASSSSFEDDFFHSNKYDPVLMSNKPLSRELLDSFFDKPKSSGGKPSSDSFGPLEFGGGNQFGDEDFAQTVCPWPPDCGDFLGKGTFTDLDKPAQVNLCTNEKEAERRNNNSTLQFWSNVQPDDNIEVCRDYVPQCSNEVNNSTLQFWSNVQPDDNIEVCCDYVPQCSNEVIVCETSVCSTQSALHKSSYVDENVTAPMYLANNGDLSTPFQTESSIIVAGEIHQPSFAETTTSIASKVTQTFTSNGNQRKKRIRRKKVVDKNSEQYKASREKNNASVKRCRSQQKESVKAMKQELQQFRNLAKNCPTCSSKARRITPYEELISNLTTGAKL